MNEKETGGYAYPRKLPNIQLPPDAALRVKKEHSGMTLRDYFAGQILGSLSSNEGYPIAMLAERSYRIADAMIKERSL